eukprot:CAMPEP_0184481552 /NCGR_PEP_ID=MMETSP0113_2-20130426/3109_1 /TAXON_ID=91329 /ORGANISM="Norrisiella sphaerica, Strain BC52" /LENGTH=156 /DNA_ID=CAMNT_0026860745 /DNA_START=23 /DNA_END=490 /DNA_ORIENTATION=-
MEDYFADLDELFAEIKSSSNNKAKVDELLMEADDIITQLKIEMASISNPEEKNKAMAKTKSYEKKIQAYKRKALLGDGEGSASAGPQMSSVEKSKEGLHKLKNAKQMLAETEEVGNKVLSDLAVQKEVIKRSTNTMKETNKELSIAQKLANKMGRW